MHGKSLLRTRKTAKASKPGLCPEPQYSPRTRAKQPETSQKRGGLAQCTSRRKSGTTVRGAFSAHCACFRASVHQICYLALMVAGTQVSNTHQKGYPRKFKHELRLPVSASASAHVHSVSCCQDRARGFGSSSLGGRYHGHPNELPSRARWSSEREQQTNRNRQRIRQSDSPSSSHRRQLRNQCHIYRRFRRDCYYRRSIKRLCLRHTDS